MNSTQRTVLHGYVTSDVDGAVRLRFNDGSIVAFTVRDGAAEARLQGKRLRLPKVIAQITEMSALVALLRASSLRFDRGRLVVDSPSQVATPKAARTRSKGTGTVKNPLGNSSTITAECS